MITIRAATVGDIPAVLALWAAAATEPSVTDDDDGVRALLRTDPESLLLAIEGDGDREAVVGTVIASWDGWRGAMYRLAVLPSHRRRGIAAMLVSHGERRLHALGARRFHLVVLRDEPPANAFWTTAGYERQDTYLRYVKTFPENEP